MIGEEGLQSKKVGLGLLAFILWAATSVLAFLEILTVRAMVVRIYGRIWGDYRFYGRANLMGSTLGIGVSFIMGILCLGMIIGTGEYHLKNYGRPKSWELFARTIAVELSILVLALFI